MKTKKNIRNVAIALILSLFYFSSCEKYAIEKPVVTEHIYYTPDIQNIFNSNCATSSCHGGSVNPSLKAGKSYNALVPNYVNVDNPEESILYKQITTKDTHIPRTNDLEKAKILTWIKQGALNDTLK